MRRLKRPRFFLLAGKIVSGKVFCFFLEPVELAQVFRFPLFQLADWKTQLPAEGEIRNTKTTVIAVNPLGLDFPSRCELSYREKLATNLTQKTPPFRFDLWDFFV